MDYGGPNGRWLGLFNKNHSLIAAPDPSGCVWPSSFNANHSVVVYDSVVATVLCMRGTTFFHAQNANASAVIDLFPIQTVGWFVDNQYNLPIAIPAFYFRFIDFFELMVELFFYFLFFCCRSWPPKSRRAGLSERRCLKFILQRLRRIWQFTWLHLKRAHFTFNCEPQVWKKRIAYFINNMRRLWCEFLLCHQHDCSHPLCVDLFSQVAALDNWTERDSVSVSVFFFI